MRILTFEKRKKVDARWGKALWESPGLTLESGCVRAGETRRDSLFWAPGWCARSDRAIPRNSLEDPGLADRMSEESGDSSRTRRNSLCAKWQ